MIIAIDFDDTLMNTKNIAPGYKMGAPEPNAVLVTKKLVELGHTIIIFTARDVRIPSIKKAVEDWCKYYDIPISGVTNVKSPYFDVMVDNRGLKYTNWTENFEQIMSLTNNHTTPHPQTHSVENVIDITKPVWVTL